MEKNHTYLNAVMDVCTQKNLLTHDQIKAEFPGLPFQTIVDIVSEDMTAKMGDTLRTRTLHDLTCAIQALQQIQSRLIDEISDNQFKPQI